MSVERLIATIRAIDGNDVTVAAATRRRVLGSLERRTCSRRRLLATMTALTIVFAGTASWALVTGQLERLRRSSVVPRPTSVLVPRHPAVTAEPSQRTRPEPAAPAAPATPAAPAALDADIAPSNARVRRPAPPQPAIEPLYRHAHELEFHGTDPAAALEAWDAYLAAEPGGRFAVEARYNRAIALVRLGRYAEARRALEPFARGEVTPAGYRQTEAAQLVDRLANYE